MQDLILAIPTVLSHTGEYAGGHMYSDYSVTGMNMGFAGVFFVILVWVLIIFGFVFLIQMMIKGARDHTEENKESRQNHSQKNDFDPSIEILRKRYAKSEINEDEFERRRKYLMRD